MDDQDYLDEIDEDEDEFEAAMLNCGMIGSTNHCAHAGTEHCDWQCPFSADASHNRRLKRKRATPLFGDLP